MQAMVDRDALGRLLQGLEAYRVKYAKKALRYKKIKRYYSWYLKLFFIAGLLTLVFVVILPVTLPVLISGGVILIVDMIIAGRFRRREEEFYRRFKEEVMPAAAACSGNGLAFIPEPTIDKELFNRTRLVDDSIDKFHAEDQLQGKFQKVEFKCCEVRAGRMVLSGKKVAGEIASGCLGAILELLFGIEGGDGMGDEADTHNYVKCFHGLLLISDFHKSFDGDVLLRPKQSRVSAQVKSSFIKVEIGDVNFDKKYDVYTSDQVLARYILSPYLIQQISLLDDHCPDALLASFLNGRMCIGLPQDRDLFEADYFKGIPDIKAFDELVAEIEVIERLLDHLNQNTRIWGDKALED